MTEVNDEPTDLDGLFTFLGGPNDGWLFRGQGRYGWNLTTRLERELKLWPVDPTGLDRLAAEAESINTFIAKARHLLPALSEEDLLGWIAVMQHYGAPTRLLGLDPFPLRRVLFRVRRHRRRRCGAALWMLDERACRLV